MHDSSGDHTVSVEGSVSSPWLSPDGKRIYYLLAKNNSSGEKEIWSRDVSSGKSDPVVTGLPVTDFDISQDQANVAFSVRNGATSQIFVAAIDRMGPGGARPHVRQERHEIMVPAFAHANAAAAVAGKARVARIAAAAHQCVPGQVFSSGK